MSGFPDKPNNEILALVIVASATSTPKPDIAVAGEKGLTSQLGLQKGWKPEG
jgi:hypothetical protein